MPNWSDPAEIARDADAFNKLIFVLFGMYFWELVITSPFDYSVIVGQRAWKWPLVLFYFLTRYTLLWALIGLMITINVTTEINCQALYTFCQWAGNTAIAGASTCLMLRTIAVWKRKIYIVVPLVVISLGQWGLLYYGIFTVHAVWSPEANACAVTGASASVLNVLYFYTMSMDAIVLVLSTLGLLTSNARSNLWNLLLRDGILYFVVTFSVNTFPAVLNVLNLNPAMNIISAVPATTISSIAATRVVVRLMTFTPGAVTNLDNNNNVSIGSQRARATLAKYSGGGTLNINASAPVLDREVDDIELDHKVRRFPSVSTGRGELDSGVWDGHRPAPAVRVSTHSFAGGEAV